MIYDNFQAGPGTIAEAMIRGLPIILNDYIAGQVFFLTNSAQVFL
jgi:1,2-diacylglycerol 3-beta-galactosyltransferase